MTSNDIEEFMREVLEENMSPAKISNLAKVFNKFRMLGRILRNSTESAEFWGELLRAIKDRCAQEIDLFVADGIKGLEDKFR